MWKFLIFVLVPVLAETEYHVVKPEDEIIKSYKATRALLTPEQEEFLMELLAADDAIIEATSRGIVDDILQAISGAGSSIRVNVVGGSGQPPSAPAPTNTQQQPAVNIINPTFTLVGQNQSSSDASTLIKQAVNSAVSGITNATPSSSSASAPQLLADISTGTFSISSTSSSQGAPIQVSGGSAAPQSQSNVTTIGGNNNHLFQTISSVIRNSNARNVTGIVDESLRIATPAPVREFVTGILNVVYCNGIRRLLGRC